MLALENTAKMEGMYLGIDENGLSFRPDENVLLLGGGSHRTGEKMPQAGDMPVCAGWHSAIGPESREIAAWSAQDCMTLDGVPYIGPFSSSTPHWYVATGFQKWGMTSSMVAAQILTSQIMGRKPSGRRSLLSTAVQALCICQNADRGNSACNRRVVAYLLQSTARGAGRPLARTRRNCRIRRQKSGRI